MNKRDFNKNLNYFFKAFLIAFIPIMVIIVLAEKFIQNQLVVWLVTFILVGLALLIAYILKLKKDAKDESDAKSGKKDKFDPYAD